MIPTHTAEFVSVTDLVPQAWTGWFWDLISESAPFTWGTNNRTLVTALDFANHCAERLALCDDLSEADVTAFLQKVRKLGWTYVGLEN